MTCESEIALFQTDLEKQQETIKNKFPTLKRVSDSLLQIEVYQNGKFITRASGFTVGENHVVTAWHVIKEADNLVLYSSVEGHNYSTIFDSGEIVVDPDHDVAVFALPEVYKGIIPPNQFSNNYSKDRVFLVGFPAIDYLLPWPRYKRQPTIHSAHIFSRENDELALLSPDDDWKVLNGISGGAVVDPEGGVMGIVKTSTHRPCNHIHCVWAVDIDFVRSNLIGL